MAQKKRPKRSWLKALLFYIFFPLIVWGLAFAIWLYWYDLTRLFSGEAQKSKAAVKASRRLDKSEKADAPPANRPQEKILDEDRKSLEDILKRRQ
jgi:hypothetical protein